MAQAQQQTTMKRIASELGVSVTTISKVLNNHGDISEATRDRVLATSATPSPAASPSAAPTPSASSFPT